MKNYRGVIIGHTGRGNYGHALERSFEKVPEVEVVGIADRVAEGLAKTQQVSKAKRAYSDYREMLQKEKPDLAVIAPHWYDERLDMVKACVDAGVKGIYLEKPMAATLSEADQIIQMTEAKGVRIVMDHWRNDGYHQMAKDMIDAGAIGKVQLIRGYGKGDDRSGGVDLILLGTHILDAMLYITGSKVNWAHGHVMQEGRDIEKKDAFEGPMAIGLTGGKGLTGYFSFQNGIIGQYESFWLGKLNRWESVPSGHHLGYDVHGTKGILSVRYKTLHRFSKGFFMVGKEYGEWEQIQLPEWDSNDIWSIYVLRHEMAIRELAAALEENRPLKRCSSGQDSRDTIEMVTAIHQSHLSGQRISFPLKQRGNPYV